MSVRYFPTLIWRGSDLVLWRGGTAVESADEARQLARSVIPLITPTVVRGNPYIVVSDPSHQSPQRWFDLSAMQYAFQLRGRANR